MLFRGSAFLRKSGYTSGKVCTCQRSTGHDPEESLPHTLGRTSINQRTLLSQALILPLSCRRLSWGGSVWCGNSPFPLSSLWDYLIGNNKEEGASRLLFHGLGMLCILVPQVPAKGAKPLLMFVSDRGLLA